MFPLSCAAARPRRCLTDAAQQFRITVQQIWLNIAQKMDAVQLYTMSFSTLHTKQRTLEGTLVGEAPLTTGDLDSNG